MPNHLRFRHAAGPIRFFWFCFSLALALAAAPAAHAQGADFRVGLDGSYSLSPAFTVLEDRGGALTLDEVLQPARQALFRPVPQSGSSTNFGLTASAFWLRIQLRTEADAPASWLLEVAYPALDQLDLYTPAAGGGFAHQRGGDLPFAGRAVPHRNHVLPVTLQPGRRHARRRDRGQQRRGAGRTLQGAAAAAGPGFVFRRGSPESYCANTSSRRSSPPWLMATMACSRTVGLAW